MSTATVERPSTTAKHRRTTVDTTDLLPGSKWRVLRGDHAGAVVEVTGFTKARRVRFHPVGAEGANNGRAQHFDDSTKWTKPAGWFVANYTLAMPAPRRVADEAEAEPKKTIAVIQPPYRRVYTPRPKPPTPEPPPAPVTGLINTRQAEFNVSLEMIAPDRARAWLDNGGLNRHFRLQYAQGLKAAILRGEWKLDGATIKLDKQGRVRDGQHRLWAIAESGVTVPSLVVFGVDEEAFSVMDTGRSRTISDVVGLHGYKYSVALSATVRCLILYDATGRLVANSRDAQEIVTSSSTLQFLDTHPDVPDAVRGAGESLRQEFPGGISVWASTAYLFRHIDSIMAEDFVHKLLTGEGMSLGNPVLVLRNRLTSRRENWLSNNRDDKEALAASIIKSWNGFRRGEVFERGYHALHWRSSGRTAEPFPVPQ